MKKSSLVIDCRLIAAHGIGTYIKNLLRGLADDNRFTLTLLHYQKDKDKLPLKGHFIEMNSPIYTLQEQLEWVRKIPECSLFFSPHFNVPLLPIRAKRRMTTIHDVFHLAHFSTLPWKQKIYAKIMLNGAALISDQVVTISQFSKDEIYKYLTVKPKNLKVVLNGIDLEPKSISVEAVKTKYHLPESFILAVGNGKPHKNLHRLFESYEDNIVVVGAKKIFQRDNIYFVGQVLDEEMAAFYKLAKCLVFPSLYEGFGYPPLEAMALGCPVVASNIGSLKEVCGDAAIFVNPYDNSSLRDGIEKALKDKEHLSINGLSHVKKYELNDRVKELIEVIYENCDPRGG